MIFENMTREEMIKFIKAHCVKVIKDIPNTNFKAGQYYEIDQSEAGVWLIDDNHKYFDLYEIDPHEYLEDK
jgi:hypothetical protein